MYDLLLKIMEPHKDKVSFYDRMKTMHEFFDKHGLYDEMWETQPDKPMSFVWAVTTKFPEVFEHQLASFMQMPGLIREDDQLVFVIDAKRKNDVMAMVGNLGNFFDTKVVVVKRGFEGDRPTFNWDIGLDYAKHDRAFFIRDLALFFQPWETVLEARKANIDHNILNFSVVLGPLWSRFCDKWMYLLHKDYAPAPFLFSFVTSIKDIKSINGFDQVFRRGFDHTGELDFLLRWNMKGYSYSISDGEHIMHPGLTAERGEIQEMQFQSSINRRYFFDRYGEELINHLQAPYKLDMSLIDVNSAKTLDPLSHVFIDHNAIDLSVEDIKDAFSFAKRPNKHFVIEEI